MVMEPKSKSAKAFTVTELMVTIACVALLAAIFLPTLARSRVRSSRISCSNNMKQIGLSFRTWAIDNNDLYPMHVSVTNAGTMELAASGVVFPHFQTMSNELSTPIILLCPNDKERSYATSFTSNLTDKALSYFVNINAVEEDAASLLTGDRNIVNRAAAGSRLVNLTKGATIAWTRKIHSEKGNLCFADGRVEGVANGSVGARIQIPDGVTNRLAVP
jgi:prepilin-type processing-associated H-X9-DG protein